MCIRFTSDDRRVISAGANDNAVMQWRTLGVNQYDSEYDWAVMECIDWATQKLIDSKYSKVRPSSIPFSVEQLRCYDCLGASSPGHSVACIIRHHTQSHLHTTYMYTYT